MLDQTLDLMNFIKDKKIMAKNGENPYLDIGTTGGTTWSVPFDQDFCDSLTGSYPSIK